MFTIGPWVFYTISDSMIVTCVYGLKIITAASIFFVWVVRYDNIVSEFNEYQLPNWLRDLVGILKLSFVAMLFSNDLWLPFLGATGLAILMLSAYIVHIQAKHPFYKMIPALGLFTISCLFGIIHWFHLGIMPAPGFMSPPL